MDIIKNLLPIILIIVGIYSLLYVYFKELDTFVIEEGFSKYNNKLHDIKDNLLLSDTFHVKNNIGVGNVNYHTSETLYNNHIKIEEKQESYKNKNIRKTTDNNKCIPFELCDSFYGYNYSNI
jgi:hypothetical protein